MNLAQLLFVGRTDEHVFNKEPQHYNIFKCERIFITRRAKLSTTQRSCSVVGCKNQHKRLHPGENVTEMSPQ